MDEGGKWSTFLTEIKAGTTDFKKEQRRLENENRRLSKTFSRVSRQSFFVIHKTKTLQHKKEDDVFPVEPRKKRDGKGKASEDPLHKDVRISNYSSMPERKSSAERIFRPSRLGVYPGIKRHHDEAVLCGLPIE